MVFYRRTEQYLQGGVRFPTGGYSPRTLMRRTGVIPVPTVQSGWKKIPASPCMFFTP